MNSLDQSKTRAWNIL